MITWIKRKQIHLRHKLWPVEVPPYERKRAILNKYRRQFDLHAFVETGTCLGDTVEAMYKQFASVTSIELSAELAERAKKRFEEHQNIQILEGDSAIILADVMKTLRSPALFWLDGHYSWKFEHAGEIIVTAQGDRDTPIEAELVHILSHHIRQHVVLIDDARLFNGFNDYPTLRRLKSIIRRLDGRRKISVSEDIIRITS